MNLKLIFFSGFQALVLGTLSYLIARYVDANPPKKYKPLKKMWKKEKNARKWIMKYSWIIGAVYFTALLLYSYLISNNLF